MPARLSARDTIAAISTPPGSGGIGIIRISGPASLTILQSLFLPHTPGCSFRSHQLHYGHICDRLPDGRLVDEVLAVYMAAPRTYTREDLVEIHCHGNSLLLQTILELVLRQGAVLAEAGEFTKRAFINGRIDLTRAEAVIDLLSARTRKGIVAAEQQLAGALYSRVEAIQQQLISMCALLEVAIDFPDEEVEIVDHRQLRQQLTGQVLVPIARLLREADQGRLYREGVSVVITGLPNAGKSSLLNALLREDRALVTAIPGTTRDTIEEYLDICGLPVRIVDTAGIREHADLVEGLGIERARAAIARADLVLLLLDAAQPMPEEEHHLLQLVVGKPLLVAVNKMDLLPAGARPLCDLPAAVPPLFISAREGTGIQELRQAIFSRVTGSDEQWEEEACAPNLRHVDALHRAQAAGQQAEKTIAASLSNDLIAVDLRACLDSLREIVGETTTDDILDTVFTRFCLGK